MTHTSAFLQNSSKEDVFSKSQDHRVSFNIDMAMATSDSHLHAPMSKGEFYALSSVRPPDMPDLPRVTGVTLLMMRDRPYAL